MPWGKSPLIQDLIWLLCLSRTWGRGHVGATKPFWERPTGQKLVVLGRLLTSIRGGKAKGASAVPMQPRKSTSTVTKVGEEWRHRREGRPGRKMGEQSRGFWQHVGKLQPPTRKKPGKTKKKKKCGKRKKQNFGGLPSAMQAAQEN